MFSSNRSKLFYLFLVSTIIFSACKTLPENAEGGNNNAVVAQESEIGIPFLTKEPEIFQAETVFSTFADGEKSERRTFVARSGANRLTKFAVGEKSETAKLETADGKVFLIDFGRKIYIEGLPQTSVLNGDDSLQNYLTVERLNEKTAAAFENQGTENGLTKFLVRLEGADTSEILIFYDDAAKIVVRQEFYTNDGTRKTLLSSIETKNFQPQTDENLFRVPSDFKKVSAKEFTAGN